MGSTIPQKLKSLDISRFALRASQTEKFKPALAYWSKYYILQQIISNHLQSADNECTTYTTSLMDQVEQIKAASPQDDAITDEVVAQAFVEQFGLQTFQRADNAVRANKASRQTADTFLAAATFMDLLHIWGSPSSEVTAKVKYAKFHALRIAKAIKAGEDPNLSNPEPEILPPAADIVLDPEDPEVKTIEAAAAHQPRVEDTADEQVDQTNDMHDSSSRGFENQSNERRSSPIQPPPPQPDLSQQNNVPPEARNQAEYFPHMTPGATSDPPMSPDATPDPRSDPVATHSSRPQDFYTQPSPSSSQPTMPVSQKADTLSTTVVQPTLASGSIPVARPSVDPPTSNQAFLTDDVAVTDAQKHAKWAISALNFEDVNTAVKELRLALRSLGAQ